MLKCADNNCNFHDSAMEFFHNDIVNDCLIAGSSSLPQSDTGVLLRNKSVPGWKEHVEVHRQRAKLAESMSDKRSVDFGNEIKKIKGTHKAMPGMVDGAQTEEKISQIFSVS